MFWIQVRTLIKKNLLVSYRTKEIFIELTVPLIMAIMLSLKAQLGVLNQIIPIMFSLSISATSRSIMIQLIDEKSKRYKETQKIMGISNQAYMTGWFMTAYIRMGINVFVFIISQMICNSLFDLNWQQNYTTSFGMVQLEFIIFSFTAINQSFFFASVFSESKIAGEVSTFLTVAMTFFTFVIIMPQAAGSLTFYIIISMVSPQANCCFGFIASLQPFLANPKVINFFPTKLVVTTFPLEYAILELTTSYFAYFLLFLYCDQVIPNEYGISKHPLFFLEFLRRKQNVPQSFNKYLQQQNMETSDLDESSALYHEQMEINDVPSIKIRRLMKEYGNFKAVDNLTLNLYESQIFCLLGHNGAGKTTTLSLLTGMIQKSRGDVSMYGLSLDNDLQDIRKSLGLCTQRDCLYDGLTVQEHLYFIGNIKGGISLLEIDSILNKTDLNKERHFLVSQLSGGTKRKLSLAMALVGNSKIIFLDEPTSGMDAQTRRSIWDILGRIKQEKRTIILTTHHLDEAEVLADRIGIMQRGQLLAVGSSEFIKKKFGEGYNLRVGVSKARPDIRESIIDIVNYHIPLNTLIGEYTTKDIFCFLIPFKSQNLLSHLFEQLEQIGTIDIQMQMNTLEDAFINIGLEEERKTTQFEDQQNGEEGIDEFELKIHNHNRSDSNSPKMKTQLPKCLSDPPNYKFKNQVLALFLRRFYTAIRTNTNLVALFVPALTYLVGLNVMNYMVFPSNSEYSSSQVQDFMKETMLSVLCIIGFTFNSTIYITLPVMERETQMKAVLHGMGLRVLPYWIGTFLFDQIVYGILILFYFITSFIINITVVTDYFWQTLFVFVCFSFSYIPYAYMWGFVFNTTEKALKLFAIFNFFIMFILPIMFLVVLNFFRVSSNNSIIFEYIMFAFQLIYMLVSPFYTFFEAYALLQGKARYQYVVFILEPWPIVFERYWVYGFALVFQGILFSLVIYYLEKKKSTQQNQLKNPRYDLINNQNTKQIYKEGLEEDVCKEYARVLEHQCDDSVQSVLLQKTYNQNGPEILEKTTFGVTKGQIFGIIGPNGAGKSTILNIFSGLVNQTGGAAVIDNIDVQNRDTDVMEHIGICPQFDSLWDNLTPVEHLSLFGRIKGLVGDDLEEAKNYFIETMQLKAVQQTQAGRLSGGNKRKLCVADALIGGSDITFFDEPSTGVDPLARKFLFRTLKRNVQLRNCSVIMTTHTIEEAETLSEKIGFLIVGQFKCIGSPEYLRKTYGTGYQINVKYSGNADDLFRDIIKTFCSAKNMEDKRAQFMTISLSALNFSFFQTFKFFEEKKNNGEIEEFSINQR